MKDKEVVKEVLEVEEEKTNGLTKSTEVDLVEEIKEEDNEVLDPASKFDPYDASLKFENEEAERVTEEHDQQLFFSITNKVKLIMKQIVELKNNKPENSSSEVEELKVEGLMLMLTLRRLSRVQKVRVHNARDKTADFRGDVDDFTLQLQNLMYEILHLKKEVRKCLEFQSGDADIDLVSIEEFYKEAPPDISKPDETSNNLHEQKIARLNWELAQRKRQTELSEKLNSEKEKVCGIISELEAKLSSLLPQINTIIEATEPLQRALNLTLTAEKKQQKISQYLPSSLYTLWVQINAYAEACDPLIKVEISGDVEAARKQYLMNQVDQDESDSDNENEPNEENVQRKGRNKKQKTVVEEPSNDEKLSSLLSLHHLHIVVTLKNKDQNGLILKFFYAQNLRIVTVKCTVDLNEPYEQLLVDILSGDKILDCLYPNDTGLQSPNPGNLYQLQKLKQSGLTSEILKCIGKPYRWVQMLAGLQFVSCGEEPEEGKENFGGNGMEVDVLKNDDDVVMLDENSQDKEPTLREARYVEKSSWRMSVNEMSSTIVNIKRRLEARLALQSQFAKLERATSNKDIPIDKDLRGYFPAKIAFDLTSWKPIPWSYFENIVEDMKSISEKIEVNSTFMTFKVEVKKENTNVSLEAFVAISQDYPKILPTFTLKLFVEKEESPNSALVDIEKELNSTALDSGWSRSQRLNIVSYMLYKMISRFDKFFVEEFQS